MVSKPVVCTNDTSEEDYKSCEIDECGKVDK